MSAHTHSRPILVVVVGPTGSGKSDLAVRLAKEFDAPILSTDSRQVYRGMAIGTAQPPENQLIAALHYFIADREPTQRFTCADFEREALALIQKLFTEQQLTHPSRRPIAIAVGGSGLYIDALCGGLDPMPEVDTELRNILNNRLKREGLAALLEELHGLDPVYWAAVDRHNPARVIRGLEVCLSTGRPFSEQRTSASLHHAAKSPRPFDIYKIGIDLPRAELYTRIDARVDAMMAAGLEAEARTLYHLKHLPALQTVGYSELFDHFDGLYAGFDGTPLPPTESLARAVELIKRNSRRYAKRQMTWFRRDPNIVWIKDLSASLATMDLPIA